MLRWSDELRPQAAPLELREVSLLVRHNLLRQSNSLNQIDVVLAHPQALAQCLLRQRGVVRPSHGLSLGERPPMRKPPTGEPYAGKPPVRFGGRGRRKPIPTPIIRRSKAMWQGQR